MKGAFEIFRRDLKNIFKNYGAIIVVIYNYNINIYIIYINICILFYYAWHVFTRFQLQVEG